MKACPDEATFRGLVAARLGYEPFAEVGTLALRVQLPPGRGGVTGNLELSARGMARGQRAGSTGF